MTRFEAYVILAAGFYFQPAVLGATT